MAVSRSVGRGWGVRSAATLGGGCKCLCSLRTYKHSACHGVCSVCAEQQTVLQYMRAVA
jgi:hypothetical protein